MSTDHHSMFSYDEKELSLTQQLFCTGTHKVRYHADEDWDFHLDVAHKSVDLSLVLPHYRARHQPVDHRMSMFVGSETGPIKLKVCRSFNSSRIYLEVHAASSDVTVWLPSNFQGQIHYSGKASFSAGFINKIMQNVVFNEETDFDDYVSMGDTVICTGNHITFKMWDIRTSSPENARKEAIKRMFGCTRKAPETSINWDFLLDD